MMVKLKSTWFVGRGRAGRRIRRGEPPSMPVYVPDELRDLLPTTAVIVEDTADRIKAAAATEEIYGALPAKEVVSRDTAPEPTPPPSADAAMKYEIGKETPTPGPSNPTTFSEMTKAMGPDPIQAAREALANTPKPKPKGRGKK